MKNFVNYTSKEKKRIINNGGSEKKELINSLQSFIEENKDYLTKDQQKKLFDCDYEFLLVNFGMCENLEEIKEICDQL